MAGSVNAGSIVYEVDMDTARLLAARREVDAALNGLSGSMGRLDASVTRTERSVASMERTMSGLSGVAKGVIAALSIQQVAQYGNEWVTVNNKLANSVRASEQLADVTQRVFDISQNTRSSLEATATLYGRLERSTRSAGTSTADLITLTSTINKGLAVSGATTEEASSTMTQLSQALASGVLRGEEFNSISENGSRLAVALADSLGVTIGQLRGMAAQGKLTTEVVVNGLLKQSDAIAKEFGNTALTMGQAFTVATNNITKFVGESSSVSTSIKIFNDGVISLSENLGPVAAAIGALTIIMGSKFAAALTLATTAKLKSTMASVQQSAADKQLAKDEMGAASAIQRRAIVEKEAAIAERARAESTLAGLKATNASTVAEVAHAEAEMVSIRVNLQQIQAEKALEIQRGRAQISDQGRIATATRMAQLRQAETVLIQRLATAETVAQNARAAAYATASAQITTANAAVATTTATVTAANGALSASQERVAATSITAMSALKAVNSFLLPLGGVAGILMIAAAGWYLYSQNQAQARKESIAFADTLPDVIAKLKEMNLAQAQGVRADTITSIKNQKEAITELQGTISTLTAEYNEYNDLAIKFGVTNDENNGYVIKSKEVANDLAKANRDLAGKTATLNQAQDALRLINIQVNQGIVDQMKAARDNAIALEEAEKKTSFLGSSQGFLAEKLGVSTVALQKFNAESLKINWGGSQGEKLIKQAERRLTLAKLEGEEKARQQAAYDAEDAGTVDPLAINRLQNMYAETEKVTQARKDQEKEDKSAASEAKKLENQQESIAQKLANLRQQSELSADSTKELTREQQLLRAEQSLGAGATDKQRQEARDYKAAAIDAADAAKGVTEALKNIPEEAENKSYTESAKNLKAALNAEVITKEEYYKASEVAERQHKVNLAKINAENNAGVTPLQDAQALVDPVQALANENARKLALIQQFETEKGVITANGLALMNAQNTEYEQARIDAAWKIWENQNQTNQLLGGAIDSLQGGATNAITGLIDGTQSLQESLANIGSTILSSVVGGLVEMGLQYVKSMIMGQVAATASLAATTAQATAAAAAWAPAAMSASIATYGTAATVGSTAYAGALAMAQGMAVAGARKNGGPVSAGSMYQVGEGGMPEIYQASTGKQYMIPGDNGSVISNKDIGGTGSAGSTIQQHNYFTFEGSTADTSQTQATFAKIAYDQSLRAIKDQQRPGGMLQKSR